MSELPPQGGALRKALEASYASLRRRLAKRLGSSDAASEVLHETFVRLESYKSIGTIANPEAYVMRAALNVAIEQKRQEKRTISSQELHGLWTMCDGSLSPDEIASARAEMALFRTVLEELPARRRAILVAARVEEVSHQEIAERFGISKRMVQYELRGALEHCSRRMQRKLFQRFGPASKKHS